MTAGSQFDTIVTGDVLIVEVLQRKFIDDLEIQDFSDRLARLIEDGHSRILLDLARVSYISSTSLGMLVRLSERLDRSGGRLAICNLHPMVRELVHISHLEEPMGCVSDRAAGLERLRA